jgi:hypothetical protein
LTPTCHGASYPVVLATGPEHGCRPADRDDSNAGRCAPAADVEQTGVERLDGPAIGHDAQMRTDLADAPRWVLGTVTGIPFGAATGVYTTIDEPTSWTEAIVAGLIAGVIFGATMAYSLDQRRREVRAAAGDLPANKFRSRAAARGPVPTDPEIRAAARRIATQQLDRFFRGRKLSIAAMALAVVFGVGMALTGSPWRLLYALGAGALLINQRHWPQRIRRRIALLSDTTEETAE